MEIDPSKKYKLRWAGSALLGVLALFALKHWVFPSAPTPRLLTAPVRLADIEQTVLASGTIEPHRLVSVGAQASGRIVTLHCALGDYVAKGQLIAEIDPSTERNDLQKAEASLAQGRAQRASRAAALRQAELAFKRATATVSQEATSLADYEAADATYDSARADIIALDAQIRQASIAVDTARVTLGYTKVLAPIDGTIVAIVAPEGQTVNAVQAAPTIVKLADLETMTVKAQISEADVTKVRPGQRVYFTILGDPGHRYEAKLRAVAPAPESIAADTTSPTAASTNTASSSAVYYNGFFEISNSKHELRPSMTAQVNIVLREAHGVPAIPAAALGDSRPDGRRVVRVVDAKGGIQSRLVRVGIDNGAVVQILNGLQVGENVAVGESPAPLTSQATPRGGAGAP